MAVGFEVSERSVVRMYPAFGKRVWPVSLPFRIIISIGNLFYWKIVVHLSCGFRWKLLMWEIFEPRASSLNVEKMEIACLMRDILKALNDFERDFERTHGVCLNEAAVLCSLKSGRLSASDIAAKVGLTPSHASKVIRSIERKGLVERVLGQQDRRQMYFDLTPCGRERLDGMRCGSVEVPQLLRPVFEKRCGASEK